MPQTPSRSPRTSAADGGDGGFTLVELLITVGLLMLILGVIFASLEQVVTAEAYSSDRSASLDSMRLTLNRMTRELRQASSVDDTTSTASHLEFDTYVQGTSQRVVYDASGTTLTRKVGPGNAVPVQTGLASTSLFTYVSAPPVPGAQWVQIYLQVRPKRSPETILVLDSEVNLRNRTGALT